MAINYYEIAGYLRKEQCWLTKFSGQKCTKPNIAAKTLERINLIFDGKRKTLGGNIVCGGCPRINKIHIEPSNPGKSGAVSTLREGYEIATRKDEIKRI